MATGHVIVTYQNGTPAPNQKIEAKWFEYWWGIGQPTPDISATTDTNGAAVLDGLPSNQAVALTITSPGGDYTTGTLQMGANTGTAYITTYWNPTQNIQNDISVAGQKVGGWLYWLAALILTLVVLVLLFRWLRSGGAAKLVTGAGNVVRLGTNAARQAYEYASG